MGKLKMPAEYFLWRLWYLGEGIFKKYGPRNPAVRPDVPTNIKLKRPLWFPHLAWFLARRKIAAVLNPLGLFAGNGAFLNHPNGGVEDIEEMKNAGMKWLALNVGDHAPEKWDLIRARAAALGVVIIPWARTWTDVHLVRLIVVAKQWGSPTLVVNLEDEAKDILPPSEVARLIDLHWGPEKVGISTVVWLYNSVDWGWLKYDVFMLQYFPAEVSWYMGKLDQCIAHAKEWGITLFANTYGTYWGAQPSWYDLTVPHSFFTGDTIGHGNWWRWKA